MEAIAVRATVMRSPDHAAKSAALAGPYAARYRRASSARASSPVSPSEWPTQAAARRKRGAWPNPGPRRGAGRGGRVETDKGKNGGTKLRKKPADISILAVSDAGQQRPVIAINERKAFKHCRVSCNMREIMSGVAAGAEDAVRKHLRGITLQQLMRKVRRAAIRQN